MPLRYAAELIGMGGDDERAIRLLITLMVLFCDSARSLVLTFPNTLLGRADEVIE